MKGLKSIFMKDSAAPSKTSSAAVASSSSTTSSTIISSSASQAESAISAGTVPGNKIKSNLSSKSPESKFFQPSKNSSLEIKFSS